MLLFQQLLFFQLVQQFYHAAEIGNVASAVSTCAAWSIADKTKTVVSDKVNCRGTQS